MSNLYIQTRGRGDIHLVLLHGWAMHGGIFEPLARRLEAHCTLHLVDLPGHGHSRACDIPLEASACAAAIADAVPPAIWLGWSMGGLIALAGALEHADRIHGLAMLSSSPCFVRGPDWPHGVEADVFEQFGTDLDGEYRQTLERFLALEAMGSAHAREEIRSLRRDVFARGEPDKRVLKQGLELLDRTDLRSRLDDLATPSTWIAGSRDRLVPCVAMAWSAGRCGGAYTCIEHAGHAAFLGFSDAVAEALGPLFAGSTA